MILKAKILVNSREMVGTRHCCWGECKTDSRYPEKWPESLKELEKSGQKVFISLCKMGLTGLHDSYGSWRLYICRFLFGLSTFISLHSCL